MPVKRRGKGGKPNRYNPDACLGWAVRSGKDSMVEKFVRGSEQSIMLDLAQERAGLARAQTARVEREHAVAMRRLVDVTEVGCEWASLVTHADRTNLRVLKKAAWPVRNKHPLRLVLRGIWRNTNGY